MKRNKLEQETVIVFNEAEQMATIYTHNGKWKRRLSTLLEQRPDDVEFKSDNGSGGATYRVPKEWVKVNPKMRISDEQKRMRTEILRRYTHVTLKS